LKAKHVQNVRQLKHTYGAHTGKPKYHTNSKWFVNNYYISKQVRASMNLKSSVKYINIFNDCEFRKQYKQINIL